ncbi:MAG: hypothetical protein Q7S64_02790 [bacterium]|nr:hypothetical protein [bacterium]
MKNLLGLVMLVVGIIAFFVADATAVTLFALYFVFAGLVALMDGGNSANKSE